VSASRHQGRFVGYQRGGARYPPRFAVTVGTAKLLPAVLIALDETPCAQLWRIILGYAVVPAWSKLSLSASAEWTLFPFFLGTLFAVRVVPAVLRKVVPFDAAVLATWTERRRQAKRFDSYQWRKLFWIGLGLAMYMVFAEPSPAAVTLTIMCAAAGASGLLLWSRRVRRS
jgi:hypothetical protein